MLGTVFETMTRKMCIAYENNVQAFLFVNYQYELWANKYLKKHNMFVLPTL